VNANSVNDADDTSRLKVLLVDDDSSFRSTLAEAVRAWGYRTIETTTLADTLTMVDRERPNALLLDVKLPDGSSISVLDELRKRSPEMVIIIITGYVNHKEAFEAGTRRVYGYLTKQIEQSQLRTMLDEALQVHTFKANNTGYERRQRSREAKRGRPQRQTTAPLGNLILTAMKLLGLSYKDVVAESERLARLNDNSDMRIGKSTLGNVISGSIRQPGTAKLDSLRIILNLARADMDAAIGLQPERRFGEQLEMSRARTHEVPIDAVTRHRRMKMPIMRDDATWKIRNSLKAQSSVGPT
jgi:CheY-like chemotaxis protein